MSNFYRSAIRGVVGTANWLVFSVVATAKKDRDHGLNNIGNSFIFPLQPYIEEIFTHLRGEIFRRFIESDKYTRFCQWKNLEFNIQVSLRPTKSK